MSTIHVKRDTPWWANMQMYWLEDQVTVTFLPQVSLLTQGKEAVIKSLKLEALNQFIKQRGYALILSETDLAPCAHSKETDETHGGPEDHYELPKFVCFPTASAKHEVQSTLVVGFFSVKKVKKIHAIQESSPMHGGDDADESNARQVVKLINGHLDKLRQAGQLPILAAMPNWLGGSTGCVVHSCPTIPPIPFSAKSSSSSHRWPIILPDLSDDMQRRKGEGVTVFVLDSMPDRPVIEAAARRAGDRNALLQEIAARIQRGSIVMHEQALSSHLAADAEDQLITGKDIYGRLYGFHAPDHGLFVTGIVHELAPKAKIEWFRVLNACGVCDLKTLITTLHKIHRRMLVGDLYQKPVVINLGLVIGPPEEDLIRAWFGEDHSCNAEEVVMMMAEADRLKYGLQLVLQRLSDLGAVIVAAVGNDSNAQQWQGSIVEHMSNRAPARYPAAFPEVIAVGAVDKNGRAAKYSNYPQLPPRHNGIATYGGEIPRPLSHPCPLTTVDPASIDGMLGIYTARTYPVLSADDIREGHGTDGSSDEYPAKDDSAWAYWSGTSFATPIISAVAARVLEKLTKEQALPARLWAAEVQRIITTPSGQAEELTGNNPLPVQSDFGFGVGMLKAYQRREKEE